ncbi:transporter substrate-binding domain-containing protein (plasmid) [Nicoliella spurrieriana]|uniref:Transporter substrate-binding domain-containing protein n=1 Tax=Nicoliella spurrieriana TaxID=2925830 RepID=A0A976RQM7_9LACO|nr:transporter substrate-binding domain-containing protein [Nicoliella spurrieriana]UQS86020.1 transporter substrate-binding domain-containing protein [Nicoliella spurrieriana]
MSKKAYIYTGVIAAVVVVIGAAHLFSQKSQTASKNHVQVINVAGVAANRPYTYADGNKIGGYDGELFQELDKKLPQYKFKYSTTSQNSVFVGLESGKYDIASSGFWYSKQRAEKYLFSAPTGVADLRLVYRKDEKPINGFADIAKRNLKLAPISSDDARYNFVEDYNKQHPKAKVNLEAIGDVSSGDALKQLQQKQFDAVFYPYQAYIGVKDAGGAKGLTVSKSVGVKNDYFVANNSEKNKQLLKAINAELKKLKASGYLDRLAKKWLGEDTFKLPGAEKNFTNPKG